MGSIGSGLAELNGNISRSTDGKYRGSIRIQYCDNYVVVIHINAIEVDFLPADAVNVCSITCPAAICPERALKAVSPTSVSSPVVAIAA
jgi:hypothetical protein